LRPINVAAHLLAVDSHRITRLVVDLDFEHLSALLGATPSFNSPAALSGSSNAAFITHMEQIQIHAIGLAVVVMGMLADRHTI
jgi:hypothetical protein